MQEMDSLILKFSGGACPQTPLVVACLRRAGLSAYFKPPLYTFPDPPLKKGKSI